MGESAYRARTRSVTNISTLNLDSTDKMTKNKNKGQLGNTETCESGDKFGIILQQINAMKNGIEKLNRKFDGFTSEFNTVKRTTEINASRLNVVEKKLDSAEQYSRRNNLRFFGIPENQREIASQVIMQVINEKIELKYEKSDIENAYRFGIYSDTKTTPRGIFVKFATHKLKEEVYNRRTKLKGTRVTVREDLTKNRMKILKTALDKFGQKNVWTIEGKVKWIQDGRKHTATAMEHLEREEQEETNNSED